MPELIDSHAHLDEVADISGIIRLALQAGVSGIITVGQDLPSNRRALQLASQFPGMVYPAIGLHPWSLGGMNTAALDENVDFIRQNLASAKALGEVGLDYDKRVLKGAPRELQQEILRGLLALAARQDKPVSLHSRYAWKDALQLVKEAGLRKVVFHWYTGFSSTLTEIIEAGYFISATPAAEYHDEHRRAIREIPVAQLLLETDCPVYYGREERYRSQPSDVLRSLKAAAAIKNMDEGEAALITTTNARSLFSL
jgi:TatD DNase family protein